ncbi:MAG: hypothetical protein HZB33_04690 [Nitrospirae bacterium]|nr:hypothetical protein [Nitrospirota bacterium]
MLLFLAACGGRDDNALVDCDINSGACVKTVAGQNIEVAFDIVPKPVASMKRLGFSVRPGGGPAAVPDTEVVLDLSMPGMYMHDNRIRLRPNADGSYEGEGVLPRCTSGRRLWKAEVIMQRKDGKEKGPARASFIFRVDR